MAEATEKAAKSVARRSRGQLHRDSYQSDMGEMRLELKHPHTHTHTLHELSASILAELIQVK